MRARGHSPAEVVYGELGLLLGGALFLGLSYKKLRLGQPISPARQPLSLPAAARGIASFPDVML